MQGSTAAGIEEWIHPCTSASIVNKDRGDVACAFPTQVVRGPVKTLAQSRATVGAAILCGPPKTAPKGYTDSAYYRLTLTSKEKMTIRRGEGIQQI